tara:strand:- start:91489 stop:91914 length:426 start_codon:yes stop_codon:yes gene_type:complete
MRLFLSVLLISIFGPMAIAGKTQVEVDISCSELTQLEMLSEEGRSSKQTAQYFFVLGIHAGTYMSSPRLVEKMKLSESIDKLMNRCSNQNNAELPSSWVYFASVVKGYEGDLVELYNSSSDKDASNEPRELPKVQEWHRDQ